MNIYSNLDYSIYVRDTMALARTMVINSNETAKIINETMASDGYPSNPNDKRTWKYYMNMAGVYHPSNVMMTVRSLDTGEVINFTRENMEIHVATRRSYQYGSTYHDELKLRFPKQAPLIRGILNPVPFDVSTVAGDFDIVWYDTSLVLDGEYNVIPQLQKWIHTWVKQNYHHNYVTVTEDLMHVYLMGVLEMFIPHRLLLIRNANIGTAYAHDFHIWQHLQSHADVIQYKPFLTRKQVLYLYRNIIYLLRNAGKTETFHKLIENLLTERRIPIATYDAQHNTKDILVNVKPDVEFRRVLLNMFGSVSNERYVRDTRSIVEDEIPLAKDNGDVAQQRIGEIHEDIQTNRNCAIPTKVLESKMRDLSESIPNPHSLTMLNEWAKMASTGQYRALISIVHPVNGLTMSMSVKDAFALTLYAVWKLNKVTLDVIPYYQATMCMRTPRPTLPEVRSRIGSKYVTDDWIKEAINVLPDIGDIISTETFYKATVAINTATQRHRDLYNYRNWADERAHIERMTYEFYTDHLCDFGAGTKYTDFFKERGWDMSEMSLDDWKSLATIIPSAATGSDTANTIKLADVQRSMLELTMQMSAYTTHVIRKINEQTIQMLDNAALRIGKFSIGLNITDNVRSNIRIIGSRFKHNKRYAVGSVLNGCNTTARIPIKLVYDLNNASDTTCSGHTVIRYHINGAHIRAQDKNEEIRNDLDKLMKVKDLNGLMFTPIENEQDRPLANIANPVLNGLLVNPGASLDIANMVLNGLTSDSKPGIHVDHNALSEIIYPAGAGLGIEENELAGLVTDDRAGLNVHDDSLNGLRKESKPATKQDLASKFNKPTWGKK